MDALIIRFTKACQRDGIKAAARKHKYFMSKAEARKAKRTEAQRRKKQRRH